MAINACLKALFQVLLCWKLRNEIIKNYSLPNIFWKWHKCYNYEKVCLLNYFANGTHHAASTIKFLLKMEPLHVRFLDIIEIYSQPLQTHKVFHMNLYVPYYWFEGNFIPAGCTEMRSSPIAKPQLPSPSCQAQVNKPKLPRRQQVFFMFHILNLYKL